MRRRGHRQSFDRAVMGSIGAPHEPAVVLGVAGFQAKQSTSHFFYTALPSTVRISSSQLSVLKATNPFFDHGRGRAVVMGLVSPDRLTGDGVEGIELVAAKAAADWSRYGRKLRQ